MLILHKETNLFFLSVLIRNIRVISVLLIATDFV